MSSYPYAQLLVDMYEFPKNLTDTIASLLTEEDKETIRVAIATLKNKPSGDRMQIIINRYFGIECGKVTLKEIGVSLSTPVSRGYVQQLRNRATHYLRQIPELRPLVERISEAGIEGRYTYQTLTLPSSAQLESLRLAINAPQGETSRSTSSFLLDCFPACLPDIPCPSCRARKMLQTSGIEKDIMELAHEWQSGQNIDWSSISVTAVGFSPRTKNCLLNANIKTLKELCAKSSLELMRSPNFGRKSLNEVVGFLTSIGQRLRS